MTHLFRVRREILPNDPCPMCRRCVNAVDHPSTGSGSDGSTGETPTRRKEKKRKEKKKERAEEKRTELVPAAGGYENAKGHPAAAAREARAIEPHPLLAQNVRVLVHVLPARRVELLDLLRGNEVHGHRPEVRPAADGEQASLPQRAHLTTPAAAAAAAAAQQKTITNRKSTSKKDLFNSSLRLVVARSHQIRPCVGAWCVCVCVCVCWPVPSGGMGRTS